MRFRRILFVLTSLGVLVVLSGASVSLQAQPTSASVETYFHRAAQQYIAKNLSAARRIVADGLREAPGHPKLIALQATLEQGDAGGSDSTSSGGSGQNESPGDDSESGSAPPSQNDASAPETPGAQGTSQSDGGEDDASPQEPPSTPESGGEGEANAEEQPSDTQGQAGRAAGRASETDRPGTRLSRMQAERILRALADQELKLLREVQRRASKAPPVEKDW